MEEPVLGVGAGVWGEEILIAPTDLVRAANAVVVNLTRRDWIAPRWEHQPGAPASSPGGGLQTGIARVAGETPIALLCACAHLGPTSA